MGQKLMYPTVEKEMGMLDRVEYKKVRREETLEAEEQIAEEVGQKEKEKQKDEKQFNFENTCVLMQAGYYEYK